MEANISYSQVVYHRWQINPHTPTFNTLFKKEKCSGTVSGESASVNYGLLLIRCKAGPDLLRAVMYDLLICTLQALWKWWYEWNLHTQDILFHWNMSTRTHFSAQKVSAASFSPCRPAREGWGYVDDRSASSHLFCD